MDFLEDTNALSIVCELMDKWCPRRVLRADIREFMFHAGGADYRALKNSAELHVALYRRAAVNMMPRGER